MKKYVGVKIIQAEPMTAIEYSEKVRPLVYSGACQEGYKVVYPDRYVSWSPKKAFEDAYREIEELTLNQAKSLMGEILAETW